MITTYLKHSLIPLTLYLLISFFKSRHKWKKGQKLLSTLNLNNYKEFKNLSFGSNNRRGWKTIRSFTIDGILLISDNNMVILPAKFTLFLAHTHLPFLIDRNSKKKPYKTDFYILNEISIELETRTLQLGDSTIEYLIYTENPEQKKEIIEALKN